MAKNINGLPDRWIIDFDDLSIEDASEFAAPFKHVKEFVKPERDRNRRKIRRENWWKFGENAPKMRKATSKIKIYFAVPETSKWYIFVPSLKSWLPGNTVRVVCSDDFYIFGCLCSQTHRIWAKAQSSTLEDRVRYTHNTCFETFPFPQNPTPAIVQQIRAKALELHQYRSEQMEQKQWGITKLYNAYFDEPASQLYKLHKQLDALVLQAYGWADKGLKPLAPDDFLEKLLTLNLELAAKEKNGEAVVGPWDPTQEQP